MNKIRRKTLRNILEQLEELRIVLEDLQGEEEEYRDNMPENFQSSARYKIAEEAISNMEDAVSSLEDIISSLEAAAE